MRSNAAEQHRCSNFVPAPTPPEPQTFAITRWIKDGLSAGTILTVLSVATGFFTTHIQDQDRLVQLEQRVKTVEDNYVPREAHSKNEDWLRSTLGSIENRISNLEHMLMERGRQ